MLRTAKTLLVAVAVLGGTSPAWAFSMGGPLTPWMVPRLGYDLNMPGFLNGPMNLGEEYRWNNPVVYYGFTPDFLNYFGERGAQEIDKAFKIVNDLPSASNIDPNKFPLTSLRLNHRASALGLIDVKSAALSALLEELGLVNPNRFVYTLRNRWIAPGGAPTNYYIFRRNFDPITWVPSSYINGILWTYTLVADVSDSESFVYTEPTDPLALLGFLNTPVTAGFEGYQGGLSSVPGGFWTGLTRDDVGGLRYIYRTDNYNVEGFFTNAVGSVGGGPWSAPVSGTNATTNVAINVGLRAGIGKVRFVRVDYDSLFGSFEQFTNYWTDTVITNGGTISQNLERPVAVPDILFDAADIQGGDANDTIFSHGYTSVAFQNNDTLNGLGGNAGPGVIQPGFVVTFNAVESIWWNTIGFDNQDELTALRVYLWGSFDGSTNEPVIYPVGSSVQDLERLVLQREPGFPWGSP